MIGLALGGKQDKRSERICLTDIAFLKYGDFKTGIICVEFEYIESSCTLNYLEIKYSDRELEEYVEGNPCVLRNMDAYFRNKLLKQQYSFNKF
jgi:hypothetical protein